MHFDITVQYRQLQLYSYNVLQGQAYKSDIVIRSLQYYKYSSSYTSPLPICHVISQMAVNISIQLQLLHTILHVTVVTGNIDDIRWTSYCNYRQLNGQQLSQASYQGSPKHSHCVWLLWHVPRQHVALGSSHHWVWIFLCSGCLGDSEDSDSLL